MKQEYPNIETKYVSLDKNAVENVDIGLQGTSIYINIDKYINSYKTSLASTYCNIYQGLMVP